MSRLVLVRHAQASFGTEDYDRLSVLGHQQSHWLAEYFRSHDLQFDRVVRGSLRRHRETAEALVNLGVCGDPMEDARLNELDYDVLEHDYRAATGEGPADSREDFLHKFPQVFEGWAEGRYGGDHESFEAFEARIHGVMDDVGNGTTLVVTSGGVIGTILRRVMGLDARMAANLLLMIHNASVHEIVREGGIWRPSKFNATPHFDAGERAHARTYI